MSVDETTSGTGVSYARKRYTLGPKILQHPSIYIILDGIEGCMRI